MVKDLTSGFVVVAIAIVIITLIAIPVAIDFYEDETTTIEQTPINDSSEAIPEGDTIVGNTNSYILDINESRNQVDIFMGENLTSDTDIEVDHISLLSEGENTTVSVDNGDIDINATSIDYTNETATIEYSYSSTWGLPSNIVSLIAMIIVLIFVGLIVVVLEPFN